MPTPFYKQLLKQLVSKPLTNLFPVRYMPESITKLLEKVGQGKATINPPIDLPPNFRGKLKYYPKKCIGCQLCVKICPSNALEFDPKSKKVTYHLERCTFCAQCVDICPVKALASTKKFLLASYEKTEGFDIEEPKKKK